MKRVIIGERIKWARKNLEMSQARFSEKTGIISGVLWRIQHGDQKPTMSQLVKIAEALYRTPEWFLCEDEPKAEVFVR